MQSRLQPEILNPVIQALTAAGEEQLAAKLAHTGAARARGESIEDVIRIWLETA